MRKSAMQGPSSPEERVTRAWKGTEVTNASNAPLAPPAAMRTQSWAMSTAEAKARGRSGLLSDDSMTIMGYRTANVEPGPEFASQEAPKVGKLGPKLEGQLQTLLNSYAKARLALGWAEQTRVLERSYRPGICTVSNKYQSCKSKCRWKPLDSR